MVLFLPQYLSRPQQGDHTSRPCCGVSVLTALLVCDGFGKCSCDFRAIDCHVSSHPMFRPFTRSSSATLIGLDIVRRVAGSHRREPLRPANPSRYSCSTLVRLTGRWMTLSHPRECRYTRRSP